jgi:2,2-dialkylglycine decarboxylase (pyruvate)
MASAAGDLRERMNDAGKIMPGNRPGVLGKARAHLVRYGGDFVPIVAERAQNKLRGRRWAAHPDFCSADERHHRPQPSRIVEVVRRSIGEPTISADDLSRPVVDLAALLAELAPASSIALLVTTGRGRTRRPFAWQLAAGKHEIVGLSRPGTASPAARRPPPRRADAATARTGLRSFAAGAGRLPLASSARTASTTGARADFGSS